jgi:hypothetical protein
MEFVSRTKSMAVPHQIHTYTELRQQIHDDLRIQHPEWVEPNGESPYVILTRRVSRNSSILSRQGDPTPGKEIFQVNDGDCESYEARHKDRRSEKSAHAKTNAASI